MRLQTTRTRAYDPGESSMSSYLSADYVDISPVDHEEGRSGCLRILTRLSSPDNVLRYSVTSDFPCERAHHSVHLSPVGRARFCVRGNGTTDSIDLGGPNLLFSPPWPRKVMSP